MENTVIQHTFLKFDQSQKNRFSRKTPEPQIKEKNPRSSEKNSSGSTAKCYSSRGVRDRIQDSNPPGFNTFWANRIGSGVRFYSSFRIRIRIFKFPDQDQDFQTFQEFDANIIIKRIFAKIWRMWCSSHQKWAYGEIF